MQYLMQQSWSWISHFEKFASKLLFFPVNHITYCSSPQNVNFVIIFSLWCCSKPVWLSSKEDILKNVCVILVQPIFHCQSSCFSSSKALLLCSVEKSNRFGSTWGWGNDRISFFWGGDYHFKVKTGQSVKVILWK